MLRLVCASQVPGGTLLFLGMVPLGVVILVPVIVNILAFRPLFVPAGLSSGTRASRSNSER